MVGGLAGRLGMESLELGKCRGLLQGLLLGLTLAPALDIQVGTVGQARALLPILPESSPPPLSFQSFGQGSHGQLWASLNFPGHLGSVGPANGTRPVGLRGGTAGTSDPTLTCPHPIQACSAAWWGGSPPSSLTTRGTPGLHYLQPLVHTLGVELMVAGENSEQLPRLEVAEADHTPGRRAQNVASMRVAEGRLMAEHEPHCPHPQERVPWQPICAQRAGAGAQHSQRLLRLMAVWVEAVGWKLLDVRFGEASRLGISQPLRQAQEGLHTGRRVGSAAAWAGGPQAPTSQDRVPRDLIVLQLHVIHIEIDPG